MPSSVMNKLCTCTEQLFTIRLSSLNDQFLISTNWLIACLRGPISTSGFDDNIVAAFRKGFPVIWEELIKDYLKHRERYDQYTWK